jgi:hypothetical protein
MEEYLIILFYRIMFKRIDESSNPLFQICLKLDNLKGYLEIFGNKEVLVTNDGINPDGIRPSILK